MRYSRVLFGLALVVFAIWVIVSEQMAGASDDAVVNAQLSTLQTPISGTLTMVPRSLGSAERSGEEIAFVADVLVDNIRLNDLAMERAFVTADVARVAAHVQETEIQIDAMAERFAAYQPHRIAEIETLLSHARARLSLLESGVADSGTAGSLGDTGVQGDIRRDKIALDYAAEQVTVLEITLRAAQAGVFLQGGSNDAPSSEQRRAELEAQRDGLAADLAGASARLAAIDARITKERIRTTLLAGAAVDATVNGRLWEILAANGETVQRGQDVLRLLDCDSVIVTVSVTENIYNRLDVGEAAVFRLSGDGRSFPASVIRLAGAGAATIYQNLAVAPSQHNLERYDVALLVPALRATPELRCSIGRTGRVFFNRRPLDWLRNLWG